MEIYVLLIASWMQVKIKMRFWLILDLITKELFNADNSFWGLTLTQTCWRICLFKTAINLCWSIISPFWFIFSPILAFIHHLDSNPLLSLWGGRHSRRGFLVFFLPHCLQPLPLAHLLHRSRSDKTLEERRRELKRRRWKGQKSEAHLQNDDESD